MKKRSIFWCIQHRLSSVMIWSVIWFMFIAVVAYFFPSVFQILFDRDIFVWYVLICLALGVTHVQKKENKKLDAMYGTSFSQPTAKKPKSRKKPGLLRRSFRAMNQFQNTQSKAFEDSMMSALMGSPSRRSQEAEKRRAKNQAANQAAWERWHAQDMQKKGERDAKDAALRGKDKAAWQRKNDADYWRNQYR